MRKVNSFSKGKLYNINITQLFVVHYCMDIMFFYNAYFLVVEEVFLFEGTDMIKKIAVISAILEEPVLTYKKFNDIVSDFQPIIRGRMGIPFPEEHISVVSLTVFGDLDLINELTGKLGNLKGITVKTAISKKEVSGGGL